MRSRAGSGGRPRSALPTVAALFGLTACGDSPTGPAAPPDFQVVLGDTLGRGTLVTFIRITVGDNEPGPVSIRIDRDASGTYEREETHDSRTVELPISLGYTADTGDRQVWEIGYEVSRGEATRAGTARFLVDSPFAASTLVVRYLLSGALVPAGRIRFPTGRELEIRDGVAHVGRLDSIYDGRYRVRLEGPFWSQEQGVTLRDGSDTGVWLVDRAFDYEKAVLYFHDERVRPERLTARYVQPPRVYIDDVNVYYFNERGYGQITPSDSLYPMPEDSIAKLRLSPEVIADFISIFSEDVPLYTTLGPLEVVKASTYGGNPPDFLGITFPRGWVVILSVHNIEPQLQNIVAGENKELIGGITQVRDGRGVSRPWHAFTVHRHLGFFGALNTFEEVFDDTGRPTQFAIDLGKLVYGWPPGSGRKPGVDVWINN